MSDENYLWDRSGEPDPEIVRLEVLLGGFAMRPVFKPRKSRLFIMMPLGISLAIAAMLLLAFVLWKPDAPTSWTSAGRTLRTGETIQTDATAGTTISSESIGKVDVEPGSRLRIGASSFDLKTGTIHALIWAPPGQFSVDTPSAKAVDLGCQYTLQVTNKGTGELTVELGLVALEWKGAESFIPAGAMCKTRESSGPGTPRYLSAPAGFVSALDRFDAAGGDSSLEQILREARGEDALSLWHLMGRTRGAQRVKIFDRFAELKSLPENGLREAVLRGDAAAFDAAWNSLDLGDASFWRQWKQHLK